METSRMRLDRMLREILRQNIGTENLYYQPPEGMKLRYPCIVYRRSGNRNHFADDEVYNQLWQFTLTVMDKNPDCPLAAAIAKLRQARYDRCFVAENLYHDVFTIVL